MSSRVVDTTNPKKKDETKASSTTKKSPQKKRFEMNFEKAKKAMKKLLPENPTPEQVQAAAEEVAKTVRDPTAIRSVCKRVFNIKVKGSTLQAAGEVPGSGTGSAVVIKKVKDEIASEAARLVNAALATGQSLEVALGPIAKIHGYDDTKQFVMKIFDFYDTYFGHIQQMNEETLLLKGTIKHLVDHFGPEAKKALRARAVWNFLIELGREVDGKYPSAEILEVMIRKLEANLD